jgi:2-ketoarginine methyltransferase
MAHLPVGASGSDNRTDPSMTASESAKINSQLEPTTQFEPGLVQALQPIRGFALAAVLYQFFDSGLFEAVRDSGAISADELAAQRALDPERTLVLMRYLVVEGFLTESDGRFGVTDKATELMPYLPWYQLLIGGYGNTFLQVGEHLSAGSAPADRNLAMVGEGSCGISQFDAIPLTKQLLDTIRPRPERIVDIGCGNGRYIVELCQAIPGIVARGVELSPASTDAANKLIAAAGYSDRAQVICGDAAAVLSADLGFEPECFILGFVLQEILGQVGREGLAQFVRSLLARYPQAHIIVIEVDNRHDEVSFMREGLASAYYNPYYLLHAFTAQRLEPPEFWRELFEDCGGTVVREQTTDPNVDSTGLEIGFLVAPRQLKRQKS